MGASKEMFEDMREKEFTVNTTFKIQGQYLYPCEDYLRRNTGVVDFKIVSDTSELYATDDKFKKLVKAKKAATVACELYTNKHN
jgi:hypothetical protein